MGAGGIYTHRLLQGSGRLLQSLRGWLDVLPTKRERSLTPDFLRKFDATDSSFQRKLESSVFRALQATGSQLSLG
jgi:hypothetical protein